jgi:putative transposase
MYQRRLAGLDEKIVALYGGGMSTREIESYIGDLYGPGVSRETVSRVTAGVLQDAKEWQRRPLEQIYPILYLDALVIKIRDGQAVRNFACYLAIGVNLEGERDVLGIWFQKTEGAKFCKSAGFGAANAAVRRPEPDRKRAQANRHTQP